MKTRKAGTLAAFMWLAVASQAAFGQVCEPKEKPDECFDRVAREGQAAAESDAVRAEIHAADTEKNDVQATNAGVDTAAAGTASTTRNFLPLLRFAGLVGDGVTTEDGLIAFDVNFLLPTPRRDDAQLRILVNPAPQLYQPLADALNATDNVALREELAGGLSDTDDLRVSFTYGKKGDRLGRDFDEYRKVFTSLVNASLDVGEVRDRTGYSAFLGKEIAAVGSVAPALVQGADLDLRFEQIPDGALRDEFMQGVARFATQRRLREEQLTARAAANGLDRFSQLVANQPQLYVNVERRLPQSLIGPDETTVVLTWERGVASLRDYDKSAPAGCDGRALATLQRAPAPCLAAYAAYVGANSAALDAAKRTSLSLEYAKVDRYVLVEPQSAVSLTVPGSEKLAASFSFGGNVRGGRVGERFDVLIKYEHAEDDAVLNDRTVAGFTFSRKTGDSVFPVTVLYASKGELAGDDGDELTINFGMAFELIR